MLVWVASGNAQDDASESAQGDYARNGFYLGVTAVAGINLFEDQLEKDLTNELSDPTRVVSDLDAEKTLGTEAIVGLNGRFGYRFHPNLSAEAQIEILTGVHANGTDGKASTTANFRFAKYSVRPTVYTTNVKGYLPLLNGRLQPFALVGVGTMRTKTKVSDLKGLNFSETYRLNGFATRFGGGLDFYATESLIVSLGLDYVLPFGDVKGYDYFSGNAGILVRF
jgi:opacity protein-like surface antigen